MDGKGLDGDFYAKGCACTESHPLPHWFSLELDAPRTVTKVQIARRTDAAYQGENVRITIGPSREYDANETLCRPEIPNLEYGGLIDYTCTGDLPQGKYVKLSKAGEIHFTICEVKVFVRAETTTTTSTTISTTTTTSTTPTGLRLYKTEGG